MSLNKKISAFVARVRPQAHRRAARVPKPGPASLSIAPTCHLCRVIPDDGSKVLASASTCRGRSPNETVGDSRPQARAATPLPPPSSQAHRREGECPPPWPASRRSRRPRRFLSHGARQGSATPPVKSGLQF